MNDGAMQRFGWFSLSSLLLSVATAVLVWIMASSGELTRISRFPALSTAGIPIELLNVGEGLMVVEGDNQSLRADLLVATEQASALRASDLRAQADLAGLGPGRHQVEVRVTSQPAAPKFRLISSTPNRIVVTLEEIAVREVPITVVVTDPDSVPQSLQIQTPSTTPAALTVTGPRSLIEAIDHAEVRLAVRGARATVEESYAPLVVDRENQLLDESRFEMQPTRVQVTVPIEQREGYRELVVRPVLSGTPAANYQPGRFTYAPQTVTVVGQPSIVNALNGIVDTEPINIDGLTEGEYTRYVPLVLPDSVSTLEEGPITVKISIEPRTGTRSVTLAPTVTGVGVGVTVAPSGIVPANVDLLLKGPLIELDVLNATDVVVLLDMTGKDAGTYLITPRIVVPGGLSAESIIPQQVEVTLVETANSREVTVPVVAANLAEGLEATIEPTVVTARLFGDKPALTALDPATLSAEVDLSGLAAGTYTITPTLSAPSLTAGPIPAVTVVLTEP